MDKKFSIIEYLVDPLSHVSYVLYHRPVWGWVLFPCLSDQFKETAGLAAEQEFKWGEAWGTSQMPKCTYGVMKSQSGPSSATTRWSILFRV